MPDPSSLGLSREKLTPRPMSEKIAYRGTDLDKSLAIEIMRQCRAGFLAWNRLIELIDSLPPEGPADMLLQTAIFGEIQNVLVCAGIVSQILWPKPFPSRTEAQRAASIERGRRLRDALRVSDSSPLNDKVLRNSVEHIDERFEDHYVEHGHEPIRDFSLVLQAPPDFRLPASCARGFIVSRNEVWLFGDSRDLQAAARALWDLADSYSVPVQVKRSTTPDGKEANPSL